MSYGGSHRVVPSSSSRGILLDVFSRLGPCWARASQGLKAPKRLSSVLATLNSLYRCRAKWIRYNLVIRYLKFTGFVKSEGWVSWNPNDGCRKHGNFSSFSHKSLGKLAELSDLSHNSSGKHNDFSNFSHKSFRKTPWFQRFFLLIIGKTRWLYQFFAQSFWERLLF